MPSVANVPAFTLAPDTPNTFGPRKLPLHTLIPAMVLREGRLGDGGPEPGIAELIEERRALPSAALALAEAGGWITSRLRQGFRDG